MFVCVCVCDCKREKKTGTNSDCSIGGRNIWCRGKEVENDEEGNATRG